MNRFALIFVLLAASFSAAPLAAATNEPVRFNTILVERFHNANGMAQSPDFIQYFSDDVSERWRMTKSLLRLWRGTPVPDAAALTRW